MEVKDGKITLTDKDYKPADLNKNLKIEGPISHVTTTPFAVVVGTSSKDELMNKLCRMKADEFINYWKNWQKYEPRVFLDTELSKSDMKKYSLILYGDAEANLITKKLGNKIPLKISSSNIEIAGKLFKAEDACVQMVYPHPLNNQRYVSVIGATSAAGMYFYNQRNENYDFSIQDGSIGNSQLGFPSDKLIVARGVFDNSWKVNEKYIETGDHELRKKCPRRRVMPDLTTVTDNLPEISQKALEAVTGKYEIQPGVKIDVFLESGKLMGVSPDNEKFQLYPASETEFFVDMADLLLTFNKNDKGVVESVMIHVNGQDIPARKTE
jgi:hypothetical protein